MRELSAASYRKTDHWGPLARKGAPAVAAELGRVLADQMDQATRGIDRRRIARNFVVSTMLDLPFTSGWLTWGPIAEAVRAHAPTDLPGADNFISGYECASWGYSLRYALRELQPGDVVLISVLDINVMNISYWESNPNWGNSGFGLATIALTLSEENRVECHIAKSINAFGEFCLDLRRLAQGSEAVLLPPYFPEDIAAMYTKIVPQAQRTENLFARWGHCFGSDPWVGLIEEVAACPDWAERTYLATSVALNGYWTFAELKLNPKGRFEILPPLGVPEETAERDEREVEHA